MMIKRVPHTTTAAGAAGLGLALAVAHELHAPAGRAPELAPAVSRPKQHRTSGRRRSARG
ncbi:hypothetical protein ACFV06_17915 [Streptomyces sp. NPDC059618]|uniref:hypothetical protein n=1 Tax=Streptomyces sp. NPDC059618 TaxID=3346887 RepID=UPI00369570CF